MRNRGADATPTRHGARGRSWGAVATLVSALVIALLVSAPVVAQEETGEPGQVRLPLDTYNQLVDAGRTPVHVPRPVPAAYAIGAVTVNVSVTTSGPQATAEVAAEVSIRVFEDEWSSVPVLPSGTPVQSATVDGQPVQLVSSPYGLIWGVDKAGSYSMNLRYRVDATRFDAGFAMGLPVPQAAATTLNATIAGTGLDVAVVPAAGTRLTERGSSTQVTATVPTTSAVQLSWRVPTTLGHALSRARYQGTLAGNAVSWTGELTVEIFSNETVTLPLLPQSVTLRDVAVDGKESPILLEGGSFATLVRGVGRHQVSVGFQTPVISGGGPPRIDLVVPQVPVSRFDLTLPGRKEVSVTPSTNVTSRTSSETTVATIFVPMSSSISFSWAEAVPEAVRAEVRANAAIYHTVYAEEGVLYVRAMVVYEVSRGETNLLKLQVPPGVQVNRIDSPSGAVADWRLSGSGGDREVSVFLDRKLQGELLLDVLYDRSLAGNETIPVPLLRATDAQRQRGMVALLQSKELTLKPVGEDSLTNATRVGENQLPAFVRDAVTMTVAHTFKYVELPSNLTVEALPPERKQGRFDAQVDTLVSLEEGRLRGSASVEVNVKSGGIMELQLHLPAGVSLLSLTGPSLRTHTVEAAGTGQRIAVHFTQEMEGQFRLEVGYERILVDTEAEDEVTVPTLTVDGAEVAQGRLAVEARSAVEVQASQTNQLTPLDINELPQQLVLRTTNPILLSYKYVQADPPPSLELRVTHHRVVPVQEAAIDEARYRTTFTPDGLAVTTADFVVRNSRKQFLRLQLPESSTVWSAFVDGKPEKPALGEGDGAGTVLIKIITSTRGFPVQLIYGTEGQRIKKLGRLHATLPRPDILVTNTRWDVYLPEGMSYGEASSNMNVVVDGVETAVPPGAEQQAARQDGAAVQAVEPLRIEVPARGVHFAFEKLYANQGDEDAELSVTYASLGGATFGKLLSLLWTALLWLGGVLAWRARQRTARLWAIAGTFCAAVLLVVLANVLDISLLPALLLSLLAGLVLAARRLRGWRPPPLQLKLSKLPQHPGESDEEHGTESGHDDGAEQPVGGEPEEAEEKAADKRTDDAE